MKLRRTQRRLRVGAMVAAALCAPAAAARAAEHITLSSGFELDCSRHEPSPDNPGMVRLYLLGSSPDSAGYTDVPAERLSAIELRPDPKPASTEETKVASVVLLPSAKPAHAPTAAELNQMLSTAGDAHHHVDADLLASIMHAESGGRVHAVSRAGAQGLMQLMPATAADLGVHDAFQPEQNIDGGSAYMDQLLTRYHDDIVKAVAAYNAGSKAVDKYHGIPPYAETRAYVARVVHEFNRRKRLLLAASAVAAVPQTK